MKPGEKIKLIREQKGFSQAELARAVGYDSRSSISKIERGDSDPSQRMLMRIASVLHVSPSELISDELPVGNIKSVPKPDFELAATKAAEILVQLRITAAPVLPLQILNTMPGVLVRSFTEFADSRGLDRKDLVSMYGSEAQDAITFSRTINGKTRYIVAYNQRLPFYMLQLSLARELAFIVLGTNDVRHDAERIAEALCFTRHLLCPRPLIRSMMDAGLSLTVESVGSLTGCYGRCLAGIRETPGTHVAAGLNRLIRKQFTSFVDNLTEFETAVPRQDDSPVADFGTFMEGYEE